MERIDKTISYCVEKERENVNDFGVLYPSPQSENLIYKKITNYEWTSSFYTGMLWLSYEFTGDELFLKKAQEYSQDFKKRAEGDNTLNTHDIGFLYTLSCVADYKLTGSETAKNTALRAAEILSKRFQPRGGFIQAWGVVGDPTKYRLIIDSLLNVPLLFWASEVTGSYKYKNIAVTHINTSLRVLIRCDNSTHHTYYFDPKTGEPLRGVTNQGYSDDSCWARGQAWGILGTALAYHYTKNPMLIEPFSRLMKGFIDRLPADGVPYWDMIFTDGEEPRDTSSAAIALCGILEMDKYFKNEEYRAVADKILNSLIEKYTTQGKMSNGLLTDGMYGRMRGDQPECNIWGDYYFMEALMRIKNPDWKIYW